MCNCNNYYMKNGYVSFYGDFTKKLSILDNHLKNWILNMESEEYHIPSILDREVLEKCGYFTSFPHHLTLAATVKPEFYQEVIDKKNVTANQIDIKEKYLTPAACLHIYPMLEGQEVKNNKVITTLANVYRYEEGNFKDLTRIWEFTVREFVFVGTREYVLEQLEVFKKKTLELAQLLKLNASLQEASDHFYPTKTNMLKSKLQKANALKYEIEVDIKGEAVAVASFNFHETHFSKPFHFDGIGTIVTGCVGFGLERWMAAFEEYDVDLEVLRRSL